MQEIYQREMGLFGVSTQAVQAVLAAAGEPCVSWELQGRLAVGITLRGEGDTLPEAEERVNRVADKVKEAFPDQLFSETKGTLWDVVVSLYGEKKRTFALAESCTGGLIAKTVTDVPGASGVFPMGVVSYSEEAKEKLLGVNESTVSRYGIVSKETAAEMAEGVRRLAQTSVGIGVTGFAGPDGGDGHAPKGTVFVALSDGKNVFIRHLSMTRSDRSGVRGAAALHALDMLRLSCLDDSAAVGAVMPLPAPAEKKPESEPAKAETAEKKKPWYKRLLGFFTDFPHDPFREKLRKILLLIAIGVMLFAGYKLAYAGIEMWRYDRSQEQITDLIVQGEELTEEEREDIIKELEEKGVEVPEDVENWALLLLQQNSDTVGRVVISTADDPSYLDQVVVQGKNNKTYLRKNFFGDYNTLGCVFMDCDCDRLGESANTILYGHSTQNSNKMFNKLQKYKTSLDFLNENPIITYYTLEEEYQYKIFAVLVVNCKGVDGEVYGGAYEIGNKIYSELDNIADRSFYTTDVDVQKGDKILTLCTCTFENDDLRLLVMARRVREGEDLTVSPAVKNTDVLLYDRDIKKDSSGNGSSQPTSSETQSVSSEESGTVSTVEEPNTRFEIYDMSLVCETGGSVKARVPYYSNYGRECSIGIGEKPGNGSVHVVSSDCLVTYTPKAGFTGTDTFTLTLTDESNLRRQTATVTVYVGTPQETGVSLEKDGVSMSVSAGESGTLSLGASSVTGKTVTYEVLKEGQYSGTASVSAEGTVTYRSTDTKAYKDIVKVIARDGEGARLIYITVNPGKSFRDNTNPVASELIPVTTPKPTATPVVSETPVSREEETSSAETGSEESVSDEPAEEPSEISSDEPSEEQAEE